MADGFVAGETPVEFVPDTGETLRDVDGYRHRPGGAPANVAVGLARGPEGESGTDEEVLREALAFGNATAALSVRSVGGTGSLPSRAEVAAFLEERT